MTDLESNLQRIAVALERIADALDGGADETRPGIERSALRLADEFDSEEGRLGGTLWTLWTVADRIIGREGW